MTTINSMPINVTPNFKGQKTAYLKKMVNEIPCPYSGVAIAPGGNNPIKLTETQRKTIESATNNFKEKIKEYMETLDKLPENHQAKVKSYKSIVEKIVGKV